METMTEDPGTNQDKKKKIARTGQPIPGLILRIFLVLVVGVVIGAVVYFSAVGWVPYLEQRLFVPLEENKTQIKNIAATQGALESQLAVIAASETEMPLSTIDGLEDSLTAARAELAEVKSTLRTLSAFSLTQVPALLETITADQLDNESHISALATAQMSDRGYEFESELMRIIALLSRANQYFLHDNYGLAEDQLLAAQQILVEIENSLYRGQREQALELISLIEEAAADLPGQPQTAGLKLELAWQLAIEGFKALPEQNDPGTPTPMSEVTPTPTQKQ